MRFSKNFLLGIVSFFGVGLISKKMPGTVASLCGMLLLLLIPKDSLLALSLALLTFFIGVIFSDLYITKYKYENDKDPGYVVIDEICGMLVSISMIYHFGLNSSLNILFNFLLFRFFDILKPFPIRNIETLMKQNDKTVGFGIMIDDVIAGILAALAQIVFISFQIK